MKYPIDKEIFIKVWLEGFAEPNEHDTELAEAFVDALNAAYETGLRDGEAGVKA